ncbi:hypothetical protein EC968_002552 [Mortierella alpina]|nr:hypothetical protein EC968_002552 [Mortierella alpina]
MGFLFGFLCGLLFIPLSILAGAYYFFTYSESYAEKREEALQQEKRQEQEQDLDLDDMPSALYASYLSSRHQGGALGGGLVPEHLDPQYQFSGWISVKRIPEVDHRIVEPSLKKEAKRHANRNGNTNNRKGSYAGGLLDEPGSLSAAAAMQDPRFAYLDTQNPHLALPPSLQARFKDSKYGVVKGTTMFVYENEYMDECLGVITLPNYHISVPGNQKDSHVFAKRNPIWLKYQPASNHTRRSTAGSEGSVSSAKDYYLSMVNCVDKEDLYFTLLRCSKLKMNGRPFIREIPKRDSTLFDKTAMDTLIRTIHSNEHQFQSAWLNALLGRIFLGVYKTPQIKDMVFQKMVDKLTRVRLPNFLNDMRMKSVHLGDGVPLITRPKLLTLKPNGDMIMDLNLLYQGGFRAEVEAEAVVTVTKKIQPIKVSLVLVMKLIRLEGRMQVWIKPPPCNRIWYGFYQKPQVEMQIEPVVSDKHIKSNLIIKAIENKMLEAIAETMVLPNMDDIPFSDSEGIGGIFGEEIQPGGETAPLQQPAKVPPKRSHSPGPRSATASGAESLSTISSTPRPALELSGELRHRADIASLPPLYKNQAGSRSHASLGDELMQTNYTYDSQTKLTNAPEDDPMRTGFLRSGQLVESPEELHPRSLQVPVGRGIKVANDSGTGSLYDDGGNSTRLFNRRNIASTPSHLHNRRGSLDPNMALSYSTGSAAGTILDSSPFPSMEGVRTMEEHWSHHGISEYEPSLPEGGKISSKDRKKMKEKLKGVDKDRTGAEGDRVSVHSKDSGDTGSTHTGNTLWTENTTQSSLYGYSSSHSTLDVGGQSPSSRPDKFSLAKMFQGFRKKHTKGSLSGSSLQMINSSAVARGEEDQQAAFPAVSEDQEGSNKDTEGSLDQAQRDLDDVQTSAQASGNLLHAYQPHFRHKFESTPNLSSALYGSQEEGSTNETSLLPSGLDSLLSVQDEDDYTRERSAGSPVPSIYAASLFGNEDHNLLSNMGSGAATTRSSPTHAPNNNLLNFSPKFGTALRKLRNRSHAGSGSSKDELSIPAGDLNLVLKQQLQQLQQQQQNLSGSESSSQVSLSADVTSSSSSDFESKMLPRPRTGGGGGGGGGAQSPVRYSDSQEDEQFPKDADGPFIPVSPSQQELVYPSRTRTTRVAVAPMIVLQKPSPYLSQGAPSSPLYAEGTFVMDNCHERSSMDDSRLRQYIPERQSLSQQPQPSTNVRIEQGLTSSGVSSSSTHSNLTSPLTRPRRHSINHPPSISPVGYNILQHIHAHGLGVNPASPLRKEFGQGEDESNASPTMTSSDSSVGGRTRNNSDTLSLTSTTSSSQSSTPRDLQSQHSSAIRNILSSLGSKGKRKGSTASQGPDPYSTVGIVGMVGVMAIGRVTTSTGADGDPYADVGGADEQRDHPNRSPLRNAIVESPPSNSISGFKDTTSTFPPTDSAAPFKNNDGDRSTRYSSEGFQEVMHARPGYVGEYPTPIRMHSRLNREAAAIRSLNLKKEKDGQDDGKHGSPGLVQDSSFAAGESSPRQGNKPLQQGPASPISKSKTLPPPKTAHFPDPATMPGTGVPMAIPVETVGSDASARGQLSPKSSQPSKNSMALGNSARAERMRKSLSNEGNRFQEMHQRSSSDSPDHTMTRCEYDTMIRNRQSSLQPSAEEAAPECCDPLPATCSPNHAPQLNGTNQESEPIPIVEEPSLDDIGFSAEQEQEQEPLQLQVKVSQPSDSAEGGQFLQPSSGPNSAPTKKTPRNIFKRLIRRKSDDAMSLQGDNRHPQQQEQQQPTLQGYPPLSSSSLYKNSLASQSQSSIATHSTTTSSKSLPVFHHHHPHHQANAVHPHDLDYREHSSTQVPTEPSEQQPEDPARGRTQSSGEPASDSGSKPFTRANTRPRSSTVGALSALSRR